MVQGSFSHFPQYPRPEDPHHCRKGAPGQGASDCTDAGPVQGGDNPRGGPSRARGRLQEHGQVVLQPAQRLPHPNDPFREGGEGAGGDRELPPAAEQVLMPVCCDNLKVYNSDEHSGRRVRAGTVPDR